MGNKKKIDIEVVRHIANLGHLRLSPKEEEKYSSQLGDILIYMEKLDKLQTDNVPPTYHPIDISNVYREDSDTGQGIERDDALRIAPLAGEGFFKVPKIISND